MMSLVVMRPYARYCIRMTELNPLEFGASAALLVPVTTWLAVWKSDEKLGARMERTLWPLIGIPLFATLWLAARTVPVAKAILFLCWAWLDVWWPRVAEMFYRWYDDLDAYTRACKYCPRH